MGCIFCDIAEGKLKTDLVEKNKDFMVFRDINPQAPVHLLVVPVHHFADITDPDLSPELSGLLLAACARLGREMGGNNGFRIVVNTGKFGGQTVNHLHFHVLAGRELQWPPG